MTDRERFEAWVAEHPGDFDLEIQDGLGPWPGQYEDYITQCAWEGWQAATAAAEQDKWAAVRRCVLVIEHAPATREGQVELIKTEFPEAFK